MARKSRKALKSGAPQYQVMPVPPDIAENIARITGEDRRWFEEHPDAEFRTRPAAADEFWPVFNSASVLYVIVTQVWPGWRLRAPVVRLNLPRSERGQ